MAGSGTSTVMSGGVGIPNMPGSQLIQLQTPGTNSSCSYLLVRPGSNGELTPVQASDPMPRGILFPANIVGAGGNGAQMPLIFTTTGALQIQGTPSPRFVNTSATIQPQIATTIQQQQQIATPVMLAGSTQTQQCSAAPFLLSVPGNLHHPQIATVQQQNPVKAGGKLQSILLKTAGKQKTVLRKVSFSPVLFFTVFCQDRASDFSVIVL